MSSFIQISLKWGMMFNKSTSSPVILAFTNPYGNKPRSAQYSLAAIRHSIASFCI